MILPLRKLYKSDNEIELNSKINKEELPKLKKKEEDIANSIYVFGTGVTFTSILSESVYVYYFCSSLFHVCLFLERTLNVEI